MWLIRGASAWPTLRTLRLARATSGLDRLVIIGHTGYITLEALRWIRDIGVTQAPGLYFLGMQWQHTRGSALLGWVKDDAEYLAERIEASRVDLLIPETEIAGAA